MSLGPEALSDALDAIDVLITAYQCTVGDLIDVANNLPEDDLPEVAETLTACIKANRADRRCRREMVLLGAVMHRLIFHIHKIPKSRDARI